MTLPEGHPAKVRARFLLVNSAHTHRFIGFTADGWRELVLEVYPELVLVVGEEDVARIAAAEWSRPR